MRSPGNRTRRADTTAGSTDDAEQDLIGSGPLGFDRWDLLYPIAPKPLLVLISAKDAFGTYSPRYVSNGWEEFQKLERIYAALGHKDRLKFADTPLPHGLTYSFRMEIYNWFERWLKPSNRKIDQEPTVEPEKRAWEAALFQCAASTLTLSSWRSTGCRSQDAEPACQAGCSGNQRPRRRALPF
jgi:hypothetical protein